MKLTAKLVREKLKQNMIDPELGINVVDLGLIYDIKVIPHTNLTSRRRLPASRSRRAMVRGSGVPADFSKGKNLGPSEKVPKIHILMTLTTPGCPLAAMFLPMIRQALSDIPGFDPYNNLEVEISFDPPWHPGLMSEGAKAEIEVW